MVILTLYFYIVYNSSESDQDQDKIRPYKFEPYSSDLPSEKSDSSSSEEGLSDNIPQTIERISRMSLTFYFYINW